MEQQFIELLASQGIFAAMFIFLFLDTRKDSKQREEKYQETIRELAEQTGINKEVKEDVEEIKKDVIEIKNKLNN
ncbi:BhlA/UviB family holin-like peptide [Clostridium perfringens]|uniref:BhlA/UviB family holin-like peptide n=1 Tax=Clostridium perfringens TaxID=1502 RepID=UPI001B839420|nr:bacteriocin [Clostridium perfringens]HBC2032870.1 bacteriocin [Clostridium perfringens]HBC2055099.1 bacteriocin [Clostridium perfringens]HBC2069823.1 bacteriocin [Clostridium perfringens]